MDKVKDTKSGKGGADLAEQRAHDREADDWFWLVVRAPNRDIHLYELGYPVENEDGAREALPQNRLAVIMAELGGPEPKDLRTDDEVGWRLEMAPGRPNAYLEPKAYDHNGNMLPIRAKAGVTLHLLPEVEPGTPGPKKDK